MSKDVILVPEVSIRVLRADNVMSFTDNVCLDSSKSSMSCLCQSLQEYYLQSAKGSPNTVKR